MVAAVTEDLAHNELGLAFDVLAEAGPEASEQFWSLLDAAVREMDLTSADPVHGPSVREVESHVSLGERDLPGESEGGGSSVR